MVEDVDEHCLDQIDWLIDVCYFFKALDIMFDRCACVQDSKNDDFAQIVDFLNAHPIRYALTVNPTIYVSYIEQFWSTAKAKTINEETQIHATVDGKKIVITQSSVRNETVTKEREDRMERAATTASSLKAEQRQLSNNPPLSRVNTLGSGEDSMKLKELMNLCTKLSDRVINLETTKTTQAKKIGKQRSIFEEKDFDDEGFDADMVEVFKDVEGDAEQVISADAYEVSTGDAVNTTSTEVNTASAPVTTVGESVSTAKPTTPLTTTTTVMEDEDLTIAQTFMKMKSEKSKVRGVVMKEPKEEERLARERKKDTNIAEWDNVQAMMDADYELVARLQTEEQG
ncbi:hypothetical protein Tco_0566114 [Tanacetum coccineum]